MKKLRSTLLIRPAARGGKYLGPDAANGNHQSALVLIMNPKTGEVVAHGIADASNPGSAGPANLMDPVSRGAPFATDGNTIQVRLSVEISEPTDFRVLVFGPLKHPGQARLAQADITVLPGVNIGITTQNPEGLVIEVPGLCISDVTANWQGPLVTCTARVTMMCGCPISNKPGWPWPDSNFSVQMVTRMQSGATHYYRLEFDKASDQISTFTGQWLNQAAQGDPVAHVWVYAAEPRLGNQGKFRVFPASPPHLPLPPEACDILMAAGL